MPETEQPTDPSGSPTTGGEASDGTANSADPAASQTDAVDTGRLPRTGADVAGAALAALLTLGLGTTLLVARRARRKSGELNG